MIKDSKTYTVAGTQLTDEKIDRDYYNNLDLIKKGLEDMRNEVQKVTTYKKSGKMNIGIQTGDHRFAKLEADDTGKIKMLVRQDGRIVKAARDDIIKLYKQRERVVVQAENYKEDPQLAHEQAKRAAISFMSQKLEDRLSSARSMAAEDNKFRNVTDRARTKTGNIQK